jgi:hypothetical protein
MAINQVSTSNTFQEWLTTTGLLIATANALTDHSPGQVFTSNTILEITGSDARFNVRTSGNINTFGANTANIANISIVGASGIDGHASRITIPGNVSVSQNITTGNLTMTGVLDGPTRLIGGANNAIYQTITNAVDTAIAMSIIIN